MPALPRAPAPVFGSHTVEVLQELGLGEQEVEALMTSGVAAVSKGKRKPRTP
jgi:crotonobetainyl-CoA:carnitine CoA-transferase CaiB-like acyl-CoA transferase|eukprot:COSAG06_NODE_196_length_20472_cov_49.724207_10_plen_52_part_00